MSTSVQPGKIAPAMVHGSCLPATGLPRVEAALALVRERVAPLTGLERIALHQATGRVLAADAHASVASPACDRSAMDGFAYRFTDAGNAVALRCIGRASAGAPFNQPLTAGACIAIATGAMLPPGCDTVVIREQCDVAGDRVTISGPTIQGQNIRHRGEDFVAGAKLLCTGTRLAPRHIGLLASAGCGEAEVFRRLRIAVLSLGDELLPGNAAHIPDANRPMLLAYAVQLGAEVSDLCILPDQRDLIASTLHQAAATHDVILCSAATSKGDEDHLHDALRDCGGEILLTGAAIKPGKPVSFSKIDDCLLIGLPGNPAAALVTFLTLAAPLLRQAVGEQYRSRPPQIVRAAFTHRKKPGMRDYLRVTLTPGADGIAQAQRCANNGAAMLASVAESDGLVWVGMKTPTGSRRDRCSPSTHLETFWG